MLVFAEGAGQKVLLVALVLCGAGCSRIGYAPGSDAAVDSPSRVIPSWQELGGSASSGGVSAQGGAIRCKRLAVAPDDTPYVLWTGNYTGVPQIYLRYWDGAAWAELGGSGAGGGLSQATTPPDDGKYSCLGDVAFFQGRPYVTWFQYVGSQDALQPIYLRYWDGASWAELGGSSSGSGISNSNVAGWWPAVALDQAGQPFIAWEQASKLYLRRWDGAAWRGLGGSDSSPGLGLDKTFLPQLEVDTRGQLFLLWSDKDTIADTAYEVLVKTWDGAAWTGLGPSATASGISNTATDSRWADLEVGPAGPVAAWAEEDPETNQSRVFVMRWDGGSWRGYGERDLTVNGLSQGSAQHPSLALDPAGFPVVVWEEPREDGSSAIRGARWDGAAWQLLTDAQGEDPLVSATTASYPMVACDSQGTIYIAYEEQVSAVAREVYLKVLR